MNPILLAESLRVRQNGRPPRMPRLHDKVVKKEFEHLLRYVAK
jgi:hypothetical protein